MSQWRRLRVGSVSKFLGDEKPPDASRVWTNDTVLLHLCGSGDMALFQHIILCLNLKHKIIPNISTKVPKKRVTFLGKQRAYFSKQSWRTKDQQKNLVSRCLRHSLNVDAVGFTNQVERRQITILLPPSGEGFCKVAWHTCKTLHL